MDDFVVEEAIDVLSNVSTWPLQDSEWQAVRPHLDAIEVAIVAEDDDGLATALAVLEDCEPGKATRLGEAPRVPAPRSIRTRLNQLVHDLGQASPCHQWTTEPQDAWELGVDAAALDAVADAVNVSGRDLVTHVFAPADGPAADQAQQQLLDVWTASRQFCVMTEPVPGLRLPTELPADLLSAGSVIAAQQNRDGDRQMILRREHDAFVLSILWAGAPDDGQAWSTADAMWAEIGEGRTDAMLVVVQLFLGQSTTESGADVGSPPSIDGEPWHLINGFTTCDLPPRSDTRPKRRLVLLTESGSDVELSAWAWSRGDSAMPPLASYLLAAAKLRYEVRVWSAAKHTARPTTRDEIRDQTAYLQDMRHTVDIARSNMATALGSRPDAGFAEDDRALADWFHLQIDDDLAYLANAEIRSLPAATTSPAVITSPADPGPTIGIVTALPEEYAAMRALIDNPQPVWIRGDRGHYVRGSVPIESSDQFHSVVLTLLSDTGNTNASEAVAHLIRSFPSIDQVLMVGIAAGIPLPQQPEHHVRLGDIVVAAWGIVDFDHVVDRPEGRTLRQGFPSPSPVLVLGAKVIAAAEKSGLRPWEAPLDALLTALPQFARPGAATDVLYASDDRDAVPIPHPDPATSGHRFGLPKVHYGFIGSSDRSLRNASVRDDLAAKYGMRAIEMEGKGIGNAAFASGREWFVVRGISDYGDARMNSLWRDYASAVAAAYVRALLAKCQPIER